MRDHTAAVAGPAPLRRVLVLRFSSAGDILLTFPALAALKRAWPSCEIYYATKAKFAPLVEHNPLFAGVVPLAPKESIFRYAQKLCALGCDATLDLHGKLRSLALAALAPTPARHRLKTIPLFEKLGVRLLLTTYKPRIMMADRFHMAAEALVGRKLLRGALRYEVSCEEQDAADAILQRAGVLRERPILGMTPGSNWATKRWPIERFAALAARASAHGYQVVLTGDEREVALCKELCARAPAAIDLAGVVPLAALGGFINRCAAFVANDSGPMHLARALGVPTLAIFGSTSPDQFDFTGHAVLCARVPCSPCHFYGRRRCPRGHFRCMLELEVEDAWAALEPLLAGGRRELVSA